jgi:hypothetical protein
LPPLIALGLLLAIALAILFARGGRPTEEKVDGQLVRSVQQTPDFTYLELEAGEAGTIWLATPRVEVEPGDRVHYESAKTFRDFEAPSLQRKFERILLVGELFKVDAEGKPVPLESRAASHGREALEQAHGLSGHGDLAGRGLSGHGPSAAASAKEPKLAKPEGGQALAEVTADPAKFAGQTVKLRGMIVTARQRVRAAAGQKPTNWYRLQDGSGAEPLLFTTDDDLQVDDVVVITGKLTLDKDFGGGLRYKLIVEGASVTRERAGDAKSEMRSTNSKTGPKDE